ncbi:MAG: PrpF domain-containing protein [Rhodopila sp.]|nr:PrpF domain-containing protein [Rhodopila sp.]
MKNQRQFPCTIVRGGTSKAVFFKINELPRDPALRDRIILAAFGSPDVRQIDGLGGADITTSKVGIIGPSTREDADIDYTFGQPGLLEGVVDYSSNCGNISAAVGPYAIDEGMVKAQEPITTVRIHNTNTRKIMVARIKVKDGFAEVEGDYVLDGVPGTGSKIELDYSGTAGSATGKLLPTGRAVDTIDVPGLGKIDVSIVDIANTVAFVRAADLGLQGSESRPQIMADKDLLARLEAIRSEAAILCGFIKRGQDATKDSPLRPMVAFVAEAADYQDYASGKTIKGDAINFMARVIYNQMAVETYTGTGTICTTTAARIKGTIVNAVSNEPDCVAGMVRFGHARGINAVEVDVTTYDGECTVTKAAFLRTARRIMDGYVYVPEGRAK